MPTHHVSPVHPRRFLWVVLIGVGGVGGGGGVTLTERGTSASP